MSSSKREQEDLKRLEDQAYFELRQIIAEAMQYQDIELLNARISYWKTKYKKLLDRPTTSSKSDFKKRIEYLLNQYYSDITNYILKQLKLKEEKMVQNQAKALTKLYKIIRDTNDYDLLKKKVAKWQQEYPVSGFLKMYQKRIELYTRDKNIRENSFKQEEAFRDLVNITKVHGTLDELKNELSLWKEKYSINNKYSIYDFIKHQTEVKRYTSDEFLESIAVEVPKTNDTDKKDLDMVDEYDNKSFSNLATQASSYSALIAISKSSNNINDMFKWVYKNRNIKFNDKYKELILSATYLDYSPAYLNKLKMPNIDISKNSLSYDEYNNMEEIKRYAIISYFNLLLPPDKAVSNDYFTKCIQTIYAKSEKSRTITKMQDTSLDSNEILDSGIEIELNKSLEAPVTVVTNTSTNKPTDIKSTDEKNKLEDKKIVNIYSDKEHIDINLINEDDNTKSEETINSTEESTDIHLTDKDNTTNKEIGGSTEESIDTHLTGPDNTKNEEIISSTEEFTNTLLIEQDNSKNEEIVVDTIEPKIDYEQNEQFKGIDIDTTPKEETVSENELDYNTVVTLSPLFIIAVNNLDRQAQLVDYIGSTVAKEAFNKEEQSQDLDFDNIKIKSNKE